MKFKAIRHTKPEIEDGICYGQTDLDILPSFHDDVARIQKKLNHFSSSEIYTSPLKRCVKLAKAIQTNEQTLTIDGRLKELNFGDWELMPWAEIEQRPKVKAWFEDYINIPCPNGESYVMLLTRVKGFLDDLKALHNPEDFIVVCHAGIIIAFHVLINHVSPVEAFKLSPEYGEIVEFILD